MRIENLNPNNETINTMNSHTSMTYVPNKNAEKERLEQERVEKERVEKERLEQERVEQERNMALKKKMETIKKVKKTVKKKSRAN